MKRSVLFLCTGNSARSILAEAILRGDHGDRFRSFSAGSRPKGEPHPLALATLAERGYATVGLSSKSWDVFARPAAPRIDLVVTVCDSAAGEACPFWPGGPPTVHWGIADPAAVAGDEATRRAAFAEAFRLLKLRIDALAALPLVDLAQPGTRAALAAIGRLEGASS